MYSRAIKAWFVLVPLTLVGCGGGGGGGNDVLAMAQAVDAYSQSIPDLPEVEEVDESTKTWEAWRRVRIGLLLGAATTSASFRHRGHPGAFRAIRGVHSREVSPALPP